uniref:Sugar ABC transporter substrate-binding protein n=1 Tax=Candidatus Methanosuratincola petrocarbonis (ex Vanwonterghem et al. 2016) TaxID=1867261 RepID=A0A7J3V153_9CREN
MKFLKRVLLMALALGLLSVPVQTAWAAKYKVGFCVMTLAFTWMQYSYRAILEEAKKYPEIELIVQDAQMSPERQVAICENFIAMGVDAIITDPLDVTTLIPTMEKAKEAGIAFVTFDRRAFGAPYLFHVGCDDVFGGRLAAEYIAAKLNGEGRIVYISGQVGSSPAINRDRGFKEQLAHYPKLKIVYEQSGQFLREEGLRVMEDAIVATGGKFDAVFCANDDSALGAIQAMKAAGIDLDKVIVVGCDGVPDALRAILAGELDASIQYPVAMASIAMRQLAEYLIYGKMPAVIDYDILPWLIVKANIETGDFYPEITK